MSQTIDITKLLNDFNAWINALPEKIMNYPPDKQAAVGAVALGSLLILVSIILFII